MSKLKDFKPALFYTKSSKYDDIYFRKNIERVLVGMCVYHKIDSSQAFYIQDYPKGEDTARRSLGFGETLVGDNEWDCVVYMNEILHDDFIFCNQLAQQLLERKKNELSGIKNIKYLDYESKQISTQKISFILIEQTKDSSKKLNEIIDFVHSRVKTVELSYVPIKKDINGETKDYWQVLLHFNYNANSISSYRQKYSQVLPAIRKGIMSRNRGTLNLIFTQANGASLTDNSNVYYYCWPKNISSQAILEQYNSCKEKMESTQEVTDNLIQAEFEQAYLATLPGPEAKKYLDEKQLQ